MTPKLLRLSTVAQMLDVPQARAYALARQGIIPVVRIGRQVRVDPAALEAWIQSGGTTNAGRTGDTAVNG